MTKTHILRAMDVSKMEWDWRPVAGPAECAGGVPAHDECSVDALSEGDWYAEDGEFGRGDSGLDFR